MTSVMDRRALLVGLARARSPRRSPRAAQPPAPFRDRLALPDRAAGSPFFEPFRAGLRELG